MLAVHLSLNDLGQLLGSTTSGALPIPEELRGVTLAPQILRGLWNSVLGMGKGIRGPMYFTVRGPTRTLAVRGPTHTSPCAPRLCAALDGRLVRNEEHGVWKPAWLLLLRTVVMRPSISLEKSGARKPLTRSRAAAALSSSLWNTLLLAPPANA